MGYYVNLDTFKLNSTGLFFVCGLGYTPSFLPVGTNFWIPLSPDRPSHTEWDIRPPLKRITCSDTSASDFHINMQHYCPVSICNATSCLLIFEKDHFNAQSLIIACY